MKTDQRKTKVLIRLRSLEMGGVQKVILDLLENLPQDVFELTLLLHLKQGELVPNVPKHIRLISIVGGKENFSSFIPLRTLQLTLRRLKLEFYLKFPDLLYRKYGLYEMDVEVASSYFELEDVLNSPNLKSKKIGWFHTDIRFVKKKLALKFIRLMKRFDVMIFGAKQTRDVIEEFYGETFPNGRVIYNVIDGDLIQKKSNEFVVERNDNLPQFISVARLQKRKNFDTLAKVHKRLLDDGFLHEIIVIGDGNHRPVIETVIDDLKIQETFKLLGTHKNPYPYIKAAEFFILPSKTESYPLIIGETLCLAKPIISTDVGGINEMIDHDVDGMLIEPEEEEIYQAMKKVLNNPNYVKQLQIGAKESYKKFDNDVIYRSVSNAFLE